MHQKLQKQFRERAVVRGYFNDPSALPELIKLKMVARYEMFSARFTGYGHQPG